MTQRLRERRPDAEIYVPRHKRNSNKHVPSRLHPLTNDETTTIVDEEEKPPFGGISKCTCGGSEKSNVKCRGDIHRGQSPNTTRRRRRKEDGNDQVEASKSNKQLERNFRQRKKQTKDNGTSNFDGSRNSLSTSVSVSIGQSEGTLNSRNISNDETSKLSGELKLLNYEHCCDTSGRNDERCDTSDRNDERCDTSGRNEALLSSTSEVLDLKPERISLSDEHCDTNDRNDKLSSASAVSDFKRERISVKDECCDIIMKYRNDALLSSACYVSDVKCRLIFNNVFQSLRTKRTNYRVTCKYADRVACKYADKLSCLLLENSYATTVKTLNMLKQKCECISTFSSGLSCRTIKEVLFSISEMERRAYVNERSRRTSYLNVLDEKSHEHSIISHFVNDIIYVANVNALRTLNELTKSEKKSCGHLEQNSDETLRFTDTGGDEMLRFTDTGGDEVGTSEGEFHLSGRANNDKVLESKLQSLILTDDSVLLMEDPVGLCEGILKEIGSNKLCENNNEASNSCDDISQDNNCGEISQDYSCGDISQDNSCGDISQDNSCGDISQDNNIVSETCNKNSYGIVVTKKDYTGSEPNSVEINTEKIFTRELEGDEKTIEDEYTNEPKGDEITAEDEYTNEPKSDEMTVTKEEIRMAREPKSVERTTKSSVTKKKKKAKEKQPEKGNKKKKEKDTTKVQDESTSTECSSTAIESIKEKEALDDWEMNYNEDGVCVKQEEYEVSVLCEARSNESDKSEEVIDYLHFKLEDVMLDIGEFGHVLEIFDFPSSYKSSDLYSLLKGAGITNYNLHWVDDTHVLAVFASQVAAHNALKVNMPFLQMRQVVNGTRESRIKSKDLKDTMLPYKKRPQTTSMVARNLVAGALGVRTNATKEQRVKEKEILRQAREEKRSKEKQRREIWDS